MAAAAGGHGCGWGGLWDMLPKAGQFFPEFDVWSAGGGDLVWLGEMEMERRLGLLIERIEAVRSGREMIVLYQRSNARGVC